MNTEAIIYTAGYFRNTKGASWEGTQLSTTPRSAYHLVSKMMMYGPMNASLLDLGSGSGCIIATAAAMSIMATGVELDENTVKLCRQTLERLRLKAKVLHVDLYHMESLNISATHVCMMNVGFAPSLQINVLRLLLNSKDSIRVLALMKGYKNRESVFWELLSTEYMDGCLLEKLNITCGTEKHTMCIYFTDEVFWNQVEAYVTDAMEEGPIETFGDKAYSKWKELQNAEEKMPMTPPEQTGKPTGKPTPSMKGKRKRSPPRQHLLTNMTPAQQREWERNKRLKA